MKKSIFAVSGFAIIGVIDPTVSPLRITEIIEVI